MLALLAVALALAVAGVISLRERRRDEARALLAAEGGRAEAERRSRTDALTGLYNRRHVLDAIAAELARSERTGVPPSVHAARPRPLQAHQRRLRPRRRRSRAERDRRRLQGRLRGYDVLGRWGGEEFIVLAPAVPDDEMLRRLAEQIRRLVGTLPVAIDDDVLLPVTVSIGAVRAGDALRSVEGLVDCAGRALAAAKRRGRDRVQLFGDLTVEDLVAEEPEPIRLARALTLSSSARAGLPHVDAERVSDLAAAIAEQLGAGRGVASRCRLGGLLHDVGTVAVGDRILGLVGPPTRARPHGVRGRTPAAGARLVRSVAGVSEAAGVVAAHEEWFDGTGYPAALSGQEIPLEARIVACAVAFVKLAAALGGAEAAKALERQAGSALDPEVVIAAARAARARSAATADAADLRRRARRLPYPRRGWPTRCSSGRCGSGRSRSRNRIVSTAHQTTLVEDGLPTDDFVAYHAARAAGGAGLICIEATAVHPSGLLTGHTIAGYDPRVVERLARVADAVHAGGTRALRAALPRRPRADRRSRRARRPSRPRRCRASASRSSRARSARARSRRSSPTTSWSPATRAPPGWTASSCAPRTATCRRSS